MRMERENELQIFSRCAKDIPIGKPLICWIPKQKNDQQRHVLMGAVCQGSHIKSMTCESLGLAGELSRLNCRYKDCVHSHNQWILNAWSTSSVHLFNSFHFL